MTVEKQNMDCWEQPDEQRNALMWMNLCDSCVAEHKTMSEQKAGTDEALRPTQWSCLCHRGGKCVMDRHIWKRGYPTGQKHKNNKHEQPIAQGDTSSQMILWSDMTIPTDNLKFDSSKAYGSTTFLSKLNHN